VAEGRHGIAPDYGVFIGAEPDANFLRAGKIGERQRNRDGNERKLSGVISLERGADVFEREGFEVLEFSFHGALK
jgi:hypothetical protein